MPNPKTTQNTICQNPPTSNKTSNQNHPKSLYSISDVNKLYRRQQTYKKKLKIVMQTNSALETRIKMYESTISDERSTILFQLNQLSRTMNSKISTYVDEKLDKDRFKDNQKAQQTIKQMIAKFQIVEKETRVTKKVYHNLNTIYERYIQYSDQINSLVRMTQKSNKQYQDGMKNMLHQKQSQIITKRQHNEDLYDSTQTAIKKIDQYEAQKLKLIDQQGQLQTYIRKLKSIQQETKREVEKFTEWAEIVIDKNHRKMFNKDNKEKQAQLKIIALNNARLEVFYKELQNEELVLKERLEDKQNLLKVWMKKKNRHTHTNKSKHGTAKANHTVTAGNAKN